MSGYSYVEQRTSLFTAEGVALLLKVLRNVDVSLKASGAVRAVEAWRGCSGETWMMLAALDYLVEMGRLREVTSNVWGQHRVFVAGDA